MVRINWTIQSLSDLKSIAKYIAKDSKHFAKLQVSIIRQRTQILKSQVYSGKVVEELAKQDIRELVEGNYRIIYKVVTENHIDIITIHHSARNLHKRKI
ncbi:type II toxin-antitoxin system RelE/ParE family toxin [Bizionia arctica]|uniref:Type II toxin-antitoxin system RelE/ParE family toxin n=1 Tax=Bizionia arctica TaxID=1495645 RepID=A0A917GHY5_9FLAO|nr:type II toxin-antitoxin system RelE/ParE family toxin [Bizionia arctica]GGG46447.1 hypothetical protein GCM10010976_17420 [Bizionia arctica]